MMGLAGFNRARRIRAGVETVEAERFVKSHQVREAVRNARVHTHTENRRRVPEVRGLESEAMQEIGRKVRDGLTQNDEPMRQEHAAEIAGRNVEGVQNPKNPVDRIRERLPEGTHNERLVSQMKVEGPGPDPATLSAAREETGVANPDAAKRGRGERRHRGTGEGRQPVETPPEGERQPRRRQAAPSETDRSAVLAERAKIEIPANWRDMGWPAQRSLGSKLSDTTVKTRPDATAAIEAELRRRG